MGLQFKRRPIRTKDQILSSDNFQKAQLFTPDIVNSPSGGQLYARAQIPTTLDMENRLGDEIEEWSYKSDSVDIDEFFSAKRLPKSKCLKIAKSNEYFSDRLEIAYTNIAMRLKRNTRDDKLIPIYCFKILPQYDAEYRDMQISRVTKITEQLKQNKIEISLQAMPSYDDVPIRSV